MAQSVSPLTFNHPQPFQKNELSKDQPASGRSLTVEDGDGDIHESKQDGPSRLPSDKPGEKCEGIPPESVPAKSREQSSPPRQNEETVLESTVGEASTQEHNQIEPRSQASNRELRSRKIHWVSPFTMFTGLLVGFFMMLGHHFYYGSLAGRVVGGAYEQQRTRLCVSHHKALVNFLVHILC
jgi:hypothetical protein